MHTRIAWAYLEAAITGVNVGRKGRKIGAGCETVYEIDPWSDINEISKCKRKFILSSIDAKGCLKAVTPNLLEAGEHLK